MHDLPITVYTAESPLRHPAKLLRSMFSDLAASRGLAWRLFVRDTSARYRQSMLGYVWAFLPPIVTTATFVLLRRSGVLRVSETAIPYPAFVVIGTLLWQVFADGVTTPLRTVMAARSMLAKINFPREAILLSGLLEILFNFTVRLVLLVAVFAFYRIVPGPSALLALGGVIAILCLGFTIGLLLTPAGMLYKDIGQALPLVLTFWMLMTPVVYTPPKDGLLGFITKLNPVGSLVTTTRDWLTLSQAGAVIPALVIFFSTIAALFAGWIAYRLTMPLLIERMGG